MVQHSQYDSSLYFGGNCFVLVNSTISCLKVH